MTTKSSNDFTSLMYAFALGTLDKEEYQKMLNYIEAGGDFMWQELGEYQNLASLLVSFLDIENPDSKVKDQIARKLYRLKEQKRPTKATESQKPLIPENVIPGKQEETIPDGPEVLKEEGVVPSEEIADNFVQSPEEETTTKPEEEFSLVSASLTRSLGARKQDTQINLRKDFEREHREVEEKPIPYQTSLPDGFEAVDSISLDDTVKEAPAAEEVEPEATPVMEELPSIDFSKFETPKEAEPEPEGTILDDYLKKYEAPSEPEPVPEQVEKPESIPVPVQVPAQPVVVKGGVSFLTILFFFLLLGGGIVTVYFMLSKQIKETTEQSANLLKQDISTIKESIADDKTIAQILNSNSLLFVNLSGTERNPGATGKFFIDNDTKTGIFQLTNLPPQPENRIYKLWLNFGETFLPIDIPASILPGKFYTLSAMPQWGEAVALSVYITEEPATGSGRISNRIYFTGSVNLK